jgi:formylglycine-generating enzyme
MGQDYKMWVRWTLCCGPALAIGIGTACGGSVVAGDSRSQTATASDGGLDSQPSVVAGPIGPSCAASGPGTSDCGPGAESCCASPVIMGGTYFRTYDGVTQAGSQPKLAPDGGATGLADPATVSDFRLDRYLVTVGRFRAFVSAWSGGNGWLPPPGSGKHTHLNGGLGLVNVAVDAGVAYETGWVASDDSNIAPTDSNLACDAYHDSGTWTPTAGENEQLPVNCVNWYEAFAFCIWDGGFLPSEAEWGYAAAGGAQQRLYPWGLTYPGLDNEYAIYNCNYPYGPDSSDACLPGVTNIAPVGTTSRGAGRWGQLDLAGEMFEWNLDSFSIEFVNPCTDCAYLAPQGSLYAVSRGSSYADTLRVLYSATREVFDEPPFQREPTFGFRCAHTP